MDSPQDGVSEWVLSGQLVNGELDFKLVEEQRPSMVKSSEGKADVRWNPDDGVFEFDVKIELLFQGDGGAEFAGDVIGARLDLEVGEDYALTDAEWQAGAALDAEDNFLAEELAVSGIITPAMVGQDEFFELRIELPALPAV